MKTSSTAGGSLRRTAIVIVLLHVIVNVAHGTAHMNLNVLMNNWQNVYIFVFIFIGPLLAGFLIWKRARRGYVLLGVSMFAALLFGVYYHFIAAGADNVAAVGHHPAARLFQLSAVLLALLELAGVMAGFMGAVNREGAVGAR